MNYRIVRRTLQPIMITVLLGFPLAVPAQDSSSGLAPPTEDQARQGHSSRPLYSPYAGRNYPMRPLFGDTHLHTAFSMDAGAFGGTAHARRCLPFRTRRAGHVVQRTAGETLKAA